MWATRQAFRSVSTSRNKRMGSSNGNKIVRLTETRGVTWWRVTIDDTQVWAIRQAGGRAKGGTAYVTLEPCNHYGRTPPCTTALLNSGVSR